MRLYSLSTPHFKLASGFEARDRLAQIARLYREITVSAEMFEAEGAQRDFHLRRDQEHIHTQDLSGPVYINMHEYDLWRYRQLRQIVLAKQYALCLHQVSLLLRRFAKDAARPEVQAAADRFDAEFGQTEPLRNSIAHVERAYSKGRPKRPKRGARKEMFLVPDRGDAIYSSDMMNLEGRVEGDKFIMAVEQGESGPGPAELVVSQARAEALRSIIEDLIEALPWADPPMPRRVPL